MPLESYGPIGPYIPLFILLIIAVIVGLLFANLSKFMGPFRPNKVKESAYESGMDPVGSAHDRFSIKFYMVAMLFILFDIEVVFMYPWAVNIKELARFDLANGGTGWFPVIEMGIFIVILFTGYIYVRKKGGFDWS